MSLTNQNREADLNGIDLGTLRLAAKAIWLETSRHGCASCECPIIEAIAVFQERGYVITKKAAPNDNEG